MIEHLQRCTQGALARAERGGAAEVSHMDIWTKKKRRYLRKWIHRSKKARNTDSGIADIPVTFGASVAFRKTYEQVAQITSLLAWDGTSRPRPLTYWKWLFYTKRAVCTTKPSSLSLVSIWRFLVWSSLSSLIYSNENCNLNLCLPHPSSPPPSRLGVHPSGSAPVERGGPDDCPHKLCVCRGAEGLSEQ